MDYKTDEKKMKVALEQANLAFDKNEVPVGAAIFDIKDNFNIYQLCTNTGDYHILKEGHEDQPDLAYKYPNDEIRTLFKHE